MVALEIKPSLGTRIRVAAVIAVAVLIALVLVYFLSGGGGEVFTSKSVVLTYMPNAAGVTPKSPVRVNGILVGKVAKVEISRFVEPQKAIRVELNVNSKFLKSIPSDSEVSVRSDNLLGDKFVLISEGKSPLPISAGMELRGEPFTQAIDNAQLIHTLERNLNDVDAILKDLSNKDTKFGQLLLTDNYYNTLLGRVVDFNKGLHAILNPKSDLGKAFFTLEAYRRIREPLMKFDAQLAAIENGEGPMGKLFASNAQYDDMVKALVGFREALSEANAGKGPLGKSLNSNEDYESLRLLLKTTDATIARFNASRGLQNAQLYESLTGSLRTLEELLDDFRGNPKKYLRIKVF